MTRTPKTKVISALLAFVASFLLWFYIVTVVNPEDSQIITNVPIQFSGEEALYQDNNLIITQGGDATVTVTVHGKRSDVRQLNRENVRAVVDVSRIRSARDYTLSYEVDFTVDLTSDVTVERAPNVVTFTVEKLAYKPVEVRATLEGNVAEGYMAQDWQYDYDAVYVRGPESVVNDISYAQVILSRIDLNKTVTERIPFTLIDADGEAVDTTNIVCDVTEIEVTLPVVQYRTIPLTVNFIDGGGATGANATYEVDPPTITVSGDSAALEGVNRIVLGTVDLATVEDEAEFAFPIVLDNNLINVSGEEVANVKVTIHGLTTKTAYVSDFRFENVPEGYKATSKTAVLIVTLRGTEETLSRLSSSDIYAVADLSDYNGQTGVYTLNALIRSDKSDAFGAVGSYTISCDLAEITDEDEPGSDESN